MNALLSVSEAARVCGVSRKTVQRHMRAGKVAWHGDVRHGPDARGIDVGELRKAMGEPAAGRVRSRAGFRPVVEKLSGFLRERLGDGDARRLLGIYIAAARNGADLDFLLYCIERLREGNEFFAGMALGKEYLGLCEKLDVYAARRLRGLAGPGPENSGFGIRGLLGALVRACFTATIDVCACIVEDRRSGKASLELVPKWLEGAPCGCLPIVGGHHSVSAVKRTADSDSVNRITEKVCRHLGSVDRKTAAGALRLLATFQNDEYLFSGRKWQLMTRLEHLYCENRKLFDRRLKDTRDGVCTTYLMIRQSASCLGLSTGEFKLLAGAWRRLSADIQSLAGKPFNDAALPGKGFMGIRIYKTVVAEVFGVSRITLAKWLKDSGGALTASARKRLRGGKAGGDGGGSSDWNAFGADMLDRLITQRQARRKTTGSRGIPADDYGYNRDDGL